MRRAAISLSIVFLLCAALFGSSLVARQARSDQDVLSALLAEVHGLRTAIEQLSATGARVQLAMGRLQLNEQRITTYTRRLDEVRDRRVIMEKTVRERQAEVSDEAAAIQQHGTPIPEIAEHFKYMKAELDRAATTLQQLKTEEAQLLQYIAAERDRWTEINQRIEDLDRTLGGR
jgi:chromosome segregation ATPase